MANANDDSLTDVFTEDLLPNEGGSEVFDHNESDEVDEIEKEAQQEAHLIRSARGPLLDHIFEWFNEEIDATDRVSSAVVLASERKISVENAVIAFDVVRDLLEMKRDHLNTLREEYAPEDK